LWVGFCFCFCVVLVVCLCFVWSVVEDDGLLDYVRVLHQFSFVALNQQTALRVNLEINAFAMP
jgi:hypothetical protein